MHFFKLILSIVTMYIIICIFSYIRYIKSDKSRFVYLEPDPQHLCGMNPALLEMHNYWCYNEFQCLQWMNVLWHANLCSELREFLSPQFIKKKLLNFWRDSSAAAAGIEPGTSRTIQFVDHCATDWATRAVEIWGVKFKS